MAEYQFPTEEVSLPSKGLLYPKDSPLSSGKVDIKYMTAKEEDILTSPNLIKQGTVVDKLLESVIVTEGVKIDDLLVGDKNAIMIATRILGYGKDYNVTVLDPDSGEENPVVVDLTKLGDKKIDSKQYKDGNEFEFELPNSKRTLTFKLLTQADEREIDSELAGLAKISKDTGILPETTTRLKKMILSVDGDTKRGTINKFVDNEFLSLDSKAFRKYTQSITPDVNLVYEYLTDEGNTIDVSVPITTEFFWPSGN